MALLTRIKAGMNRLLRPLNLRLETRTARRRERRRLAALRKAGHFEKPAFPVPAAFRRMDPEPVLDSVGEHAARLEALRRPEENDVAFRLDNGFFGSPDVEVLYAMVRRHRPATFVEVGSGWSTRVVRQAVVDGSLETRIVSVDPDPRVPVGRVADEAIRRPVERVPRDPLFGPLRPGDMLSVDSSHRIRTGGDVPYLFLTVLPELPSGVLIHVHDVFLPFDYPEEWVVERRYGWNEQYLLQALLRGGSDLEVLWAGHFLQRTRDDFADFFPLLDPALPGPGRASSLWLVKR